MKKVSLFFLAFCMAGSLVACSNDKNNENKEENKVEQKDNNSSQNEKNENNPNDQNNINNNSTDKKIQEVVKENVEKVEKEVKDKKVRLNIKPQVQEVWNYCAPTTVSMMLSSRGISVDQYKLAKDMGTYEPFGTHNKDAIRVLNKYMFGYEMPADNQAGYRLAVVEGGAMMQEEIALFKQRLKKNIDDGYPVYLTMDVSKIYPGLKGEHNVAATGYVENEAGEITQLYYLDPAPKVQDATYAGLKIETPEKILNSMLTCEEPNYAW